MYLYSVRVKETGLVETRLSSAFSLQEQLNSLAAAINALHLVDPTSAWLDLESDICGNLSCRPSKRIRIYANNEGTHQSNLFKYIFFRRMGRQLPQIAQSIPPKKKGNEDLGHKK
jgi:hypothetical protein